MKPCVFCKGTLNLVSYRGKYVCARCILNLIFAGYSKMEEKYPQNE